MKSILVVPRIILLATFIFLPVKVFGEGAVITRESKNTLQPVEMNKGDTLKFKLRNGEVRTMVLLQTAVDVIITNLNELKKDQPGGGTLYYFTCRISIDGHSLTMERYVGSQESFYEPYVINGMRIWFDGVSAIFEEGIVNEEHGACRPNKDARFAITDMKDNICPCKLNSWNINKERIIDIADCYNSDDCWMGAYNGFEAHGGLDINMLPGSPNFTPFKIDDHYYFNSLAKGDNNNRWRGTRQWDNGDLWTIQNHHMLNLLVPEHIPIKSGIHYADAAGVHSGSHHHAHYVFKVKTPEDENEILLDPWIIFWQTYEDNKKRREEISAVIAPLSPGSTAIPIRFYSDGSTYGLNLRELSYYWTFGDGGWSNEANPQYTYMNPGIYPVTLVVEDKAQKASFTQHITIDGMRVNKPSLKLMAKDEPSFRIRKAHEMNVYGVPVELLPHSLHFVARTTRPKPNEKIIMLQNTGAGVLSEALKPKVFYSEGKEWLSVEHEGNGNNQQLIIDVDATSLATGIYSAWVEVECPGVFNSTQGFLVYLTIPTYPPAHEQMRNLMQETIHHSDIRYNRFYCTPYFWVGPQFKRWVEKGYKGFYLTNGGRAMEGEFARFTPDLEAGTYRVYFTEETPFEPERRAMSRVGQQPVNPELNPKTHFAVRVRSKDGDEIIRMEPAKSRVIGTFEFEEGMDGFVEILAGGSTGQVLVDAITFRKLKK